MQGIVLAVVALVACASAAPSSSSIHMDVYRNILSPNPRIIGGEVAERRQFPYQVSLHWEFLGTAAHICGGTILNENTVITAGHCYAYPIGSYKVVVGLLNQGENNADNQESEVDQFIVHSGYPGGVAANDIAVLKLKTPLKLTEAVQAAPLGSDEDCSAIDDVILSGWGLTSILPIPPTGLRWAQLPRISNQQCADDLTALLGNAGPLDDSMICTGSNEGKKQSACSGDSGGPLVKDGKLVGVVSWGISPCGTEGAPSVYTSVCAHKDFINENA